MPAHLKELARVRFSFRPATFRMEQSSQALERLRHLQIVTRKQLSSDLQGVPKQGFRLLLSPLVNINAAQTTERGGNVGIRCSEEVLANGERFLVGLFSAVQVSFLPESFTEMIKRRSGLSALLTLTFRSFATAVRSNLIASSSLPISR